MAPTSSFSSWFDRYAFTAFSRQLFLAEMAADLPWGFSLDDGRLTVGDYVWQAEILGTESEHSQTWLWSWANTAGVPQALTGRAEQLRLWGTEGQLPWFTAPSATLDEIDPQAIAMIAVGMLGLPAFFKATYDGGAAYLLLVDSTYPVNPKPPIERLIYQFPASILQLEIHDQERAFVGFLEDHQLSFEKTLTPNGSTIQVFQDNQPVLEAAFESIDKGTRMVRFEGTLSA